MQQPRIRVVQDERAEDQAHSGRRKRRVRVRIVSGRGRSGNAKLERNLRSRLRSDSQSTLCALGAPDA